MKKVLFIAFVLFIHVRLYAQLHLSDTLLNCSKVIKDLSYYWKLDSLANNGFRLYTYDKLLNCKVDKVDRALLFGKLGKPNQTQKTNKGTEYYYYYFDKRAMPRDFEAPNACWYISFQFDEYGKYLLSIREGDMDL